MPTSSPAPFKIQGLLLAAGHASRFGRNKLLQKLPSGVPLAVAAARNLVAALPESVAVIRCGDRELARRLTAEGLGIIPYREPPTGMGFTLAHAVEITAGADGWVVALADMPYIRPATIEKVVERLVRGAPLAAPVHQARRGHPVGFHRAFGSSLRRLRGDQGAREVIGRHEQRMETVAVDDPGVLKDIDTPEDLALSADTARGGSC